MATFVPVSAGIRTASDALSLRAAAQLTTSYVASTACDVVAWSSVTFQFAWVGLDATTIQFYVEAYDGTNWTILGYQAVQGSGVSELTQDIRQITLASYSATDGVAVPPIDCVGWQQMRVYVKRTGGTANAAKTFAITATAGIGVSGRSH